MNSDRMRTVQLNVCDSKEVDQAVEHVNSSLEDPEKGRCMQWFLGHVGGSSSLSWALRAFSGHISKAEHMIEGHKAPRSSSESKWPVQMMCPIRKQLPT